MKVVLACASTAVLVVAMASAGSCSINHRSGDLVCEQQTDCDAIGRTCLDGYCIDLGGPIQDAGPGIDTMRDAGRDMIILPDTPNVDCPAQCTTCDPTGKKCNIDCSIDSCGGDATLVCPSGWNCTFACNSPNSCRGGIDCSEAASCTVNCTASGSCRDLECGEGPCKVVCSASQACRNMDCSDSCACDISCSNGASCDDNECPIGCSLPLGRCTSLGLCNSCQ